MSKLTGSITATLFSSNMLLPDIRRVSQHDGARAHRARPAVLAENDFPHRQHHSRFSLTLLVIYIIYRGVAGKRNTRVYLAAIVASEFT